MTETEQRAGIQLMEGVWIPKKEYRIMIYESLNRYGKKTTRYEGSFDAEKSKSLYRALRRVMNRRKANTIRRMIGKQTHTYPYPNPDGIHRELGDLIKLRLEQAIEKVFPQGRANEKIEEISEKAKKAHCGRQVVSLWIPFVIGLTVAAVLGLFGIPDLTTEDLRRVASLCASLLIAGLASLGIVAAFGIRTGSVEESDEENLVSVENYLVAAGLGLLASALLTCAAILVGGLSEAGWLANFICISGLVAAVLQIFSEPIALIVARKTRGPFLLDGIST